MELCDGQASALMLTQNVTSTQRTRHTQINISHTLPRRRGFNRSQDGAHPFHREREAIWSPPTPLIEKTKFWISPQTISTIHHGARDHHINYHRLTIILAACASSGLRTTPISSSCRGPQGLSQSPLAQKYSFLKVGFLTHLVREIFRKEDANHLCLESYDGALGESFLP